MHSFHHSRGRILFEVLCALTVSASCAAAWLQTGATAFLPAAFAVGLYGLWHLTDMAGRKPAPAVEMPQPAVAVDVVEPAVEAEPLEVAPPVEEAAEPAAPPVESRKAKAPRKPRARRAKAPAEPKAREPVVIDEAEFTEIVSFEDVAHPPIAPLFEPEPFARMPRRAFGRRGQI